LIFRQRSDPQNRWIDPDHASQVHACRGRIVVLPVILPHVRRMLRTVPPDDIT
jgi:hypothetical protein